MGYIPEIRVWRIHHVWILLILVIVLLECIIWLNGTHCHLITRVLFKPVKFLTCRILTGFHTFCCRHKQIFLPLISIKLIGRYIFIIHVILLRLIISIRVYILILGIRVVFWILLLIYIDRLIKCILLIVIKSRWLSHTFVTIVDHHLFQWDSVSLLCERVRHTGMFMIVGLIIHVKPVLSVTVLSSHL